MGDLLELAARCEQATGPDHMLDAEIAIAALGWREIPSPDGDWRSFESPAGARANIQRKDGVPVFDYGPLAFFTTSLDAAMTLLPEAEAGYSATFWRVGNDGEGGDPSDFKAEVLCCSQLTSRQSKAVAATPALAICAAALRARHAIEGAQ